jgi:hypothetical protein
MRGRVGDLAATDDRGDRVRREDKNERVGGLNRPVNGPYELLGGTDAVPIDPGLPLTALECLIESEHKSFVLPRVGNKSVCHKIGSKL